MYFLEAKMVWARSGTGIKRKYRCTMGSRKGRTVSNPSQCNAPTDLKKKMVMKKTKASKGQRMSRKAQKTKKYSPQSRMIRRLNK
jgi:hypothetical protein